ncbi:Uncharacterised protein [Mycobacterium tuberculosis]|nr:Uncharacterised protein [Mycobacterium tuberculosis]
MTKSSSSTMLINPDCVCQALIIAPWTNRSTTIAPAKTNPRSIQSLMESQRSE